MIESVEQLHLLTLNVGLANHYADWNWQHVNSPFARIFYVTEGEAELILPNGVYPLRPQHMYFIPPFITHSYRCNNRFVHYYLHIYEDAPAYSGFLDEWDFPVEVQGSRLEEMLFERLCQLNPHMVLPQSNPQSYDNQTILEQNITKNRQRPFCNKVESRGIIFQLFAHFLREATKNYTYTDERIKHSIAEIRKNIRLFKKETGNTPQQYINQKKIEQAQLILITEETPIKQLAYQLGFEDPSYFCRLFHQHTGYTPLQYRQAMILLK